MEFTSGKREKADEGALGDREEKICIVLEGFQSRMSAFGRFLPTEAVRRTSGLSCTTFMLWLNQRHALKAFRVSVGDVEGHRIYSVLIM